MLTDAAGVTIWAVSEVKNVKSLSMTLQIQDMIAYAQQTARRFDLYVRLDTKLSGPLEQAVTDGIINQHYIP